ncbi:hypothetical protein AAG906_017113 [Vitis piasezkii]
MEGYIDDIVVKSETQVEHIQHLEETFRLMRAYNMKLNLAKCAFGASTRKFLGFMVTQRGIEVNLAQIKVVLKTPAPSNKKEWQCLTGPFHGQVETFLPHAQGRKHIRVFGFGVGSILQSPTGKMIEQAIRLNFSTSNNEAEYEVVLAGLDLTLVLAATKLEIRRDEKQAHKLRIQTTRFTLINDQLYRRLFGGPYLKCLNELEAKYVMVELHEGICGNHPGGRTLAHRAYTQGYYWPTMKRDVESYVKKCDRCQRHAPIPRVPSEALNLITSPWSFA